MATAARMSTASLPAPRLRPAVVGGARPISALRTASASCTATGRCTVQPHSNGLGAGKPPCQFRSQQVILPRWEDPRALGRRRVELPVESSQQWVGLQRISQSGRRRCRLVVQAHGGEHGEIHTFLLFPGRNPALSFGFW